MKKPLLATILFIFISTFCWSQNHKHIDSIVFTYPQKFSSVSKLANRISSNFSTDFEKVRAIYTWITNNIEYDPNEYGKYNFDYSSKAEFEKKENKYKRKLSSRVISKGKAVCEGYSTLFSAICNELNIKSKVVSGSSKTTIKDIGKRYYPDHAWNIVFIKNKQYLIDATWGAGTYGRRFERKVNYFYFMTDPKLFIKNHYPNNYENALLKEKIEKEKFLSEPLIYNHNFKLLKPTNGIIKKSEVKIIKFKFLTEKKVNSISYDVDRKNYNITEFINNDNLEFEINLSELKREKELVIYFNYEPIIGFKLK